MSQADDPQPAEGPQMPNVFVVPPEEDDIPSWCCFNAALPLEQQIRRSEDLERDIDVFDPTVAYDDDITAMDAALARRSMETRSIVETLMARDYNIDHAAIDSDSDLEWDSENEQQPHSGGAHQSHSPRRTASTSDVGNDSDVIEVVKVSRRKRDMGELDQYRAPSTGLNRAGTLKATGDESTALIYRHIPLIIILFKIQGAGQPSATAILKHEHASAQGGE
ncbi:hypothetical protein DFP72DRAFT_1058686 [Ephemerocybe angulata]|uniref:Uncharacterized protein n=1 Tax=Ephemerocybe angulata TaxID=980116 RepID=A0A8H6IG26_9AGAR|nr:hypothetical protein DFP72DRAFT_1058686 [Tulosesus angulatus]